jgi:hypothetical protein
MQSCAAHDSVQGLTCKTQWEMPETRVEAFMNCLASNGRRDHGHPRFPVFHFGNADFVELEDETKHSGRRASPFRIWVSQIWSRSR